MAVGGNSLISIKKFDFELSFSFSFLDEKKLNQNYMVKFYLAS